jgi:hypothetical protein
LIPVTAAPSHRPGLQTEPAGYLRHAPFPSQVPSLPHVLISLWGQTSAVRGRTPTGMKVQVPSAVATLQALQVSPQAELQQ